MQKLKKIIIPSQQAHKEKFDQKSVSGSVENDKNFAGCPYCNTKQHYICGNCEKVICWHGQKTVICPSCGFIGEIQYSDKIDLKGGGM